MKNILDYREDQDYQIAESDCLSSDYKVWNGKYEDELFRLKENNSVESAAFDLKKNMFSGDSLSDDNQYKPSDYNKESSGYHIFWDDLYFTHKKNSILNLFFKYFANKHKKAKPIHSYNFGLSPLTLLEVEQLIRKSEYILTLEEGWDGDSAATIDKEIWETATSFLREYVYFIFKEYNFSLVLPEINPGRNNSIDLEWRTEKGRLLINFNKKNPMKAAFYGDRYNNEDCLKGAVDVKGTKEYLAMWMKNCL